MKRFYGDDEFNIFSVKKQKKVASLCASVEFFLVQGNLCGVHIQQMAIPTANGNLNRDNKFLDA